MICIKNEFNPALKQSIVVQWCIHPKRDTILRSGNKYKSLMKHSEPKLREKNQTKWSQSNQHWAMLILLTKSFSI